MSNELFLGIVKEGKFKSLEPTTSSDKLTTIGMQEAMAPESKRVDLETYEGKAIMVSGHDGGDWIYSAKILEEAGLILTAAVLKAFGKSR
jgi:hypothetical protein